MVEYETMKSEVLIMKWLDGNNIDIKNVTGKEICEKLATELWGYEYDQWLELEECIQNVAFIIAFDTELQMEGIFTFLENSIGHYYDKIIHAFKAISDNNDAEILSEICRLAPPDLMRGEFLECVQQEYDISSFDENHELHDEIVDRIDTLEKQLYLNTDFDMWQLLFDYLDACISQSHVS